ncbi:phosphate starvation protein PhoH [Alicyclobacillus contaminans]|nr:phosphate starvation protein PhoH [Alicyclobacillus contaminans]
MTEDFTSFELKVTQPQDMDLLLGTHDKHVKLIEEATNTRIHARGETIQVQGSQEDGTLVIDILQSLQELINRGIQIATPDVVSALNLAKQGALSSFIEMYEEEIIKDYNGHSIRPKNLGQKEYIDTINKRAVTFGIGPAGTGKTFLAVVLAINALKKGSVKRIILTRPAVEAGESLGFLPGDLKEKVDPYLRPVYDALYQIFGVEHTNRLMERGVVEIAPLAYMRGRTLDDAFVILDEAQNTTIAQMKMFLTRLGFILK